MEGHSSSGVGTFGGPYNFLDNVADRVLIACVIISSGNTYPATPNDNFDNVQGGFYKTHLSAHLNRRVPRGLDRGYKDGHAQWKKFISPPAGFAMSTGDEINYTMSRTLSGPYFWW